MTVEPATDEFVETWRKRATGKLANNPRAMASTSAAGMLRFIARIDHLNGELQHCAATVTHLQQRVATLERALEDARACANGLGEEAARAAVKQ